MQRVSTGPSVGIVFFIDSREKITLLKSLTIIQQNWVWLCRMINKTSKGLEFWWENELMPSPQKYTTPSQITVDL